MVTQQDIAQELGISVATVSKALSGRPDVSQRIRRNVMVTARRIGYQPPSASRSRVVHVVLDDLVNYYAPVVLGGLMAESTRRGLVVAVHSLRAWPAHRHGPRPGSRSWFEEVATTGCLGVVFMTVPTSELSGLAAAMRVVPLVLIDPIEEAPLDIVTIGATNWQGGRQATSHLLELGHYRIAVVAGPPGSRPSEERLAGYRSALDSAGIAHDPDLVHDGGFRYEGGLAAVRYLMGLQQPPTAIFALSDYMAQGVLDACRRRSLNVPRDVSVVGFDDGFASHSFAPPLTTVRQPLEAMGSNAISALLALARGDGDLPRLQLETQLVARASTAAPSAGLSCG